MACIWQTVLCKVCAALAQTNPQPTAASLATFYDQYYHLFHRRPWRRRRRMSPSRGGWPTRRFRLLSRFLDPARAASVLEVGPGAGSFLEKCRDEAAWRAGGVEPGAESQAWCVARGRKVEHARFEDFESAERFGLIAAFNVVDHLSSPRAFLEKCHALLADDGLLVLEVVNFDRPSLPRDQFLQFPLLYIFSFISLVNLLAATGFRPVFHDETSSDTSVGTMTVIARRMSERWEKDFIQVDLERYKKNLDRKDRIYRLAERLPRVSIFGRLRSVLKSV